jgi:hypothetical protein
VLVFGIQLQVSHGRPILLFRGAGAEAVVRRERDEGSIINYRRRKRRKRRKRRSDITAKRMPKKKKKKNAWRQEAWILFFPPSFAWQGYE